MCDDDRHGLLVDVITGNAVIFVNDIVGVYINDVVDFMILWIIMLFNIFRLLPTFLLFLFTVLFLLLLIMFFVFQMLFLLLLVFYFLPVL